MGEPLIELHLDEAHHIVKIFSSKRHINPYISKDEAIKFFFPVLELLRPDVSIMKPEELFDEVAFKKN